MLAGFYIERKIFGKNWDKNLGVELRFLHNKVAVGETTVLRETVTNEKSMPIPSLEVKFSAPSVFVFENMENTSKTDRYYLRNMFSVDGNQRISRNLGFSVKKRGYYTIPSVDILTKDYFMRGRYVKAIPNISELLVYPQKLDTSFFNPMYRSMMGEILIKQKTEIDPFMFMGIREYRNSDNMKYVNWKHSARTGELLVNTYGSTASYQVCIILDGINASLVDGEFVGEKIISLASSLAERFLKEGMPVAVKSNWKYKKLGEKEASQVSTGFGYGNTHLEAIDYQLALIDTAIPVRACESYIEDIVSEEGSERLYLVISANRLDRVYEMLEKGKKKGASMYAIEAFLRRDYESITSQYKGKEDSRICYWEVRE